MKNISIYLFSICLTIGPLASSPLLAEVQNIEDDTVTKLSKQKKKRLSLRERRKARTRKLFKNNPLVGIKPRYTIREKVSIDLKRKSGFNDRIKPSSIKEQEKAITNKQKIESRKRALDRNQRTQALIRRKEKEMRKLAHLRRREFQRQRREYLLQIQKDLIEKNRTDLANQLNDDVVGTTGPN